MKKLMAVSAFAVAFGLLADEPAASGLINKTGFEGDNYSLESSEDGSYYWTQPASDASSIKSYVTEGEGISAPTIRTKEFEGTANAKYLELSTEGGTLLRRFKPTDATDKTQAVGDGVYIDTLVQFTAMEDSDPTIDAADKIAVWLGVKTENNVTTTNLYVKAGAYCTDEDGENATQGEPAIYALQYANGSAITVEPEKWYRLTIQALPVDIPNFACFTGFKISLNDQTLKTSTAGITSTYMAAVAQADAGTEDYGEAYEAFVTAYGSAIQNNEIIPSLEEMKDSGASSALALTAVGFTGSGAIDDLVLTTDNPLAAPEGMVQITLTVPTGVTGEYSTDGGEHWTAIPATGSVPVEKDSEIWLKGTVAGGYEQVKKLTATEDAELAITTATSNMAWYFPRPETEGQDGTSAETAFEIASANDLVALKDAVANGVATADVYFKQTADIDFTGEPAFAGIGQSGAEDKTDNGVITSTTAETHQAFEGVYNGGGFTISNILMTRRTGSGLFNLLRNATIEDLTIDTVTYDGTFGTKQGGAMLAGVVAGGTTIRRVKTMGTNASAAAPITYNAAGLVNRIEGWYRDTLIESCTNAATIYCSYTKIAGLCPIVNGPGDLADGGQVTFLNCVNTGDVIASPATAGNNGVAGIVAYTQGMKSKKLVVTGCVNMGNLTGAKCAGIIGQINSGSASATGTHTAKANVLAVASGSVPGLAFATVDNDGVATIGVTPVAGGSYKVMAAGGTVSLANVGDTITLDTSLGKFATVTTTAENAEVQKDGNVYTVVSLASGIVTDLDTLDLEDDIKDLDDEDKQTLNEDWAEFKGSASFATAADQALALKNFLLGAAAADTVGSELVAKIEMGTDGKPEVTWWRKDANSDELVELAAKDVPAYVTRKIKWSVDVTFPANEEGKAPVTGEVVEGADIPPAAKFFKTLIKLGK